MGVDAGAAVKGRGPLSCGYRGQATVTQRQGWTGAGLPLRPHAGLCVRLFWVGIPLRVGEDSRADVPASARPAPTCCTVPWAQRGSVTGQAFPPVLRAFWAAWPALQADSRLPVDSPTLTVQGQRVFPLGSAHSSDNALPPDTLWFFPSLTLLRQRL